MGLVDSEYTRKKNNGKRISVIIQLLVLAILAVVIIRELYTFTVHQPYTEKDTAYITDRGFVALSYFGVEKHGKQPLIGSERLYEHLYALKQAGYVTITQKDIKDYYNQGKLLPPRSLVLMFEDGRRDTAIFAQKTLENLNFQANVMIYGEKFEHRDPKFLLPDELLELKKTTFWDIGTNGYRLAYINVFDRYDNYLGEMSPLEYSMVARYLSRRYNHFLMDYIRDEYGVPKESYNKMKDRISYDYELMQEVYQKGLGFVPEMYVLMHSNTGSFGNNDKVSAVNEYWMKQMFAMNFNREGFALNEKKSSIYDLTRMQPQAYWYPNHVLMRIKDDTKDDLPFVKGDEKQHALWNLKKGALEARSDEETLVLTALPRDDGLAFLKDGKSERDIKISVRLLGNKMGLQKIYLRADEALTNCLSIYLLNNTLYVTERAYGVHRELFKLNLDEFDGKTVLSVAEDKKEAEEEALSTFRRYAASAKRAEIYHNRLEEKKKEQPMSVTDGEKPYVPLLSIHEKGDRQMDILVKDDKLTVALNGRTAVQELSISHARAGGIALESAWGGFYGWNQRNLADDVYDGVFEKLIITNLLSADKEQPVYDGRLQGWEAIKKNVIEKWNALLEWFIDNM